ncbi:MAG: DNA repair protein RecN [Pseudomonadota bacterium]
MRRVQKADGKTRGFVNDTPVSASFLREIGQCLVEIHGQHDDRAMLDPEAHLRLLDAHGRLDGQALLVRNAWDVWHNSEKKLSAFKANFEEARREAEYLQSSSEELQLLGPMPGEEEELAERRQRLMKLEQVATELGEANQELSGNASPVTLISNLARRLERKREQVPDLVDEVLENLDLALNALYTAQEVLDRSYRETEFDPNELSNSEERLFALRAAGRKYKVSVDDLAGLAVRMADELALIEDGEDQLQKLEKDVEHSASEYFRLAHTLSQARKEASEALSDRVMDELPALKLEQARFIVNQASDREFSGSNGIDRIEFWVQTNPGSHAGPLKKVASGGELSRFLLALKVALLDRGSAPTLIFDEIDSGVGGAVADAIGHRLSRLSQKVQVLSVTHAPQVAARANGHYLIRKSSEQDEASVLTRVDRMERDSRLEEIARMLSGASITDEARAAAEKLMEQSVT